MARDLYEVDDVKTDLQRNARSYALAERAAVHDAWISAELSNSARRNYQYIEGAYPLYASHAEGAYLWDVDGNRYCDYNLGYGTIILGHADTRVTEAVCEELRRGHCLSPLWKPQQAELTELICSVVPHAERAFLMKTGSDATSGAVRLARLFTGRNHVLRWGYNGWHDWSTPCPGGVPNAVREVVHAFPYNDLDALRELFERYPGDVACVFMMPFEVEPPEPGFLEGVAELAHAHGALFVLDEMRSGFRFALGGAQEFLGIRADLVTFSKAMANGYAVSCIAGRGDVLDGLAKTKMTATYFSSAEAMTAALATIRILRDEDVIPRIWRLGTRLLRGLEQIVAEESSLATVRGYAPCPFLVFDRMDPASNQRAKEAFFGETARRGLLLHPSHHWYVSGAHTDADIDETLDICGLALRAISVGL